MYPKSLPDSATLSLGSKLIFVHFVGGVHAGKEGAEVVLKPDSVFLSLRVLRSVSQLSILLLCLLRDLMA